MPVDCLYPLPPGYCSFFNPFHATDSFYTPIIATEVSDVFRRFSKRLMALKGLRKNATFSKYYTFLSQYYTT